jgi:hypothetical protein
MHLSQKSVVDDKVRRKWDRAQTPFERLKATGQLSPEQQQRLQALYDMIAAIGVFTCLVRGQENKKGI